METGLFVKIFLYVLYFIGICLLFSRPVQVLILRFKLRKRLRNKAVKEQKHSQLFIYLQNLIETAIMRKRMREVFIIFELVLFIVSLLLFSLNFGIYAALPFSFAICTIPFIFLFIRLEKNRNKASKEGLSLASELYRQYQIQNRNVETAIERCLESDSGFNFLKPYLYMYLIRLRNCSCESDYKAAAKSFAFSMGTNWGKSLAMAINISAREGKDVSLVFADIIEQLKTAQSLETERKVLNSEATRMTIFLVPLLYLGSIAVAGRFLSVSLSQFIKNQFTTQAGFILFLVCAFLFLINILLINLVSSKRLDY